MRRGALGQTCRATCWWMRLSATWRPPKRRFAAAAHVVTFNRHVGRVTGVGMEPRAALRHYDKDRDSYTLYAGSGGDDCGRKGGNIRRALGVDEKKMRVLSFDVGGNFGTRNRLYVESALVLWSLEKSRAAGQVPRRPLGVLPHRLPGPRPGYRGGAMAIDGDGKFLAMRAR